jgi:hypothetical protein
MRPSPKTNALIFLRLSQSGIISNLARLYKMSVNVRKDDE